MWKVIIFISAMFLMAGCNKSKDVKLEARLTVAEQKIAQLEEKQKSTGNWILWKREQNNAPRNGIILGYAPPQSLSAFPIKEECANAATKLVEPGGRLISADPVEFDYGNRRVTFYCLPPDIQAGIRTSR